MVVAVATADDRKRGGHEMQGRSVHDLLRTKGFGGPGRLPAG